MASSPPRASSLGARSIARVSRASRAPRARRATGARASASGERAGRVRRDVLTRDDRTKLDASSDAAFYDQPRFVTHVDDDFLARVTELYRRRIPRNGAVLDVCSSWVSHLPREVEYARVWGHGMSATELGRNERLDGFFVRDFNVDPRIDAKDESFDAVTMCVSVQYLQRPEEVFAEIFRVLKPGGVCIVTFSNRLFYSKAIQAWRDASGYARTQLVKQYFSSVAGFTQAEAVTDLGDVVDDSIFGKLRRFFARSTGDPFYAVVAYRNFKPIYDDGDDCFKFGSKDSECLTDASFDKVD
jgi:SAM-dependent methyltransferase